MFARQTQCALSALGRLAEVYDGGTTWLSATEIAAARGLRRPFVAKILSLLAREKMVFAARGPGGGFTLARPPEEIRVYDVVRLFQDRLEDDRACPFGGGICGEGKPCPLHDKLADVQTALDDLLFNATLAAFQNGGVGI